MQGAHTCIDIAGDNNRIEIISMKLENGSETIDMEQFHRIKLSRL